jgi:hypothetical protein
MVSSLPGNFKKAVTCTEEMLCIRFMMETDAGHNGFLKKNY